MPAAASKLKQDEKGLGGLRLWAWATGGVMTGGLEHGLTAEGLRLCWHNTCARQDRVRRCPVLT
jgi:hypothetical protein